MSIVQMSVQAGMIIIAVVMIRAIALYRLPKTSFLFLWGIVVARMLIPFSLASRWSVYNIFEALQGPVTTPFGTAIPAWEHRVQPPVPMPPEGAGASGLPSAAAPMISVSPLESLWLGILSILLIVFTILLAKNYRALRSAIPVTESEFITQWRSTHPLRRSLEIVMSDKVDSPASLGILRPHIIFPQGMDMDDKCLLRYVLAHEYVHIRRFDTLWKLLALCAVCVHWFNPLAWVMLFLLNRDLELSCDEMVLRHFGGTDRTAYAHSLIDMAEKSHAFSIVSHFSKSAITERIIAIMNYKKPSLLALVLVLALAVGMTTAFATSAKEDGGRQDQLGQISMAPSQDKLEGIDLTGVTLGDCPMVTALNGNESFQKAFRLDDLKYVAGDELEELLKHAQTMDIDLIMVSPDDERKFSPEEWAKILEGIENGTIRWEDSEPDFSATADCGDPVHLTDESAVNAIKERKASFEYNKLKNEGKATTDIASGDEMPVGIVVVGNGQSITVSVVSDTAFELEVGIKKPSVPEVVFSEKLVAEEANGSATTVIPVEESGDYILYVKNVGAYNTGYSLSYLVR